MKKVSIIALIIGMILLAVGFAEPILSDVYALFKSEYASEFYITLIVQQIAFALKFFGGITAVCGIIGLIFNKQIDSHCRIETSCIALGISADVSLGIHCALSFLSCYFLTNPSRHPIRYPASIILGTLCFLAFFALMYLYTKFRKRNMFKAGIALDVGLGLLYLPAFYFIWAVADTIISELF